MSVIKEMSIENTRIKIDDEFVREEYKELILEHIATAAKAALTKIEVEITPSPHLSSQSDLN